MRKLLKQVKWQTMLTSLLYIVLGIVTFAVPETMVRTLGYMVGILLILVGAVSMICYLLRETSRNYDRNDFGYGLVGIAVGVVFLYKVEWIASLIPVILGILVLASGCVKLQHVIDMKRMECGNWIAVLILAVINVIFGAVLVLNPFDTVILLFRLVGAGLIFSGVSDCITTVYLAGRMKEFLDRVQAVDSTYTEVTEEEKGRRAEGARHDRKASGEQSGETERARQNQDKKAADKERQEQDRKAAEKEWQKQDRKAGEKELSMQGKEAAGGEVSEKEQVSENKGEGA